jgi:putrescine transport system ATP-binding protein
MELQARLGTTFLVVTHDQDEAMTMADRIAMMDRGRLVQVGTPAEIYEAPASRGVAAFVGDITLLEGRVAGESRLGIALESEAAGTTLLVAAADRIRAGEGACLGIRPEKLRLHAERPPAGTLNVLEGEVWDIGYLGNWTTYRVRLGSGAIVKVSRANASRQGDRDVGWEDRVWLSFEPASAILLTS